MKKEYPKTYTLYVGNLSDKTFDLDLHKFFSRKYHIASAKVMFDNESKRSKCFGYLNFYSQEEADKCLEEMNNVMMEGKQIVLNKKKGADFDSKANIVVRNIPKEMTQQDLSKLFGKFGKFFSCKVEVFKDGQSRGFGYVQYEK